MRMCLLMVLFIISQTGIAQIIEAVEKVSEEHWAMKSCSFDEGADAVILFDRATSNYDDMYQLVTKRRTRIKILKEKGIERANIRIPYVSQNNFELLIKIGGVVITPVENGEPHYAYLDNELVYTRRLNEIYSEISFALPNVKVGSIVEYWHQSVKDHYGGLDDWYFQHDIPVVESKYKLYMIPNAVFSYVIKKNPNLDVIINEDEYGRISFEMKDIPGLNDEVYSSSPIDYRQKVDFQLSAIASRRGKITRFTNTWADLNRELLQEKDFGAAFKKNLPPVPELTQTLWKGKSDFEKMRTIFEYVRKNISYDQVQSIFARQPLKTVLQKKKGSSGDINLLLVNLLQEGNLNAYPMLVSERSNGKVDTSNSIIRQFNKVVACVDIDGMKYILDGTDLHTPADLIPEPLLNTMGFIIDKHKYGFIKLEDPAKSNAQNIVMKTVINTAADVRTQASVSQYQYARVGKAEKYREDPNAYIQEFLGTSPTMRVDSFELQGLDEISKPLIHNIVFRSVLGQTGNYYFLNYNYFTGFDKNPFLSDSRFADIDFGTRFSCVLNASFTLPSNLVVESVPKDVRMILPGEELVAARETRISGKEINIGIRIQINNTEFSVDKYQEVREFFKKITDMLNEPVLLVDR